jgi:hypothetical protein
MSNPAAIFTITTVVLLVLVLTIALCNGVAWVWDKCFGPDHEDRY